MAIPKLHAGIPGFDTLTHGGIPEGRSTLVVGRSGTGKTIFGLQVAAHLAEQGLPVLVIAVEETSDDLIVTGDAIGLDLSTATAQKKLFLADLSRSLDRQTIVSGDYDLYGLIHRIEAAVNERQVRAVVLDSATALFSPRPPQDHLRNHFFHLVHNLRRMGVTGVILAESPQDYGQLTTLGVEDYVCDLVVILRNTVDGDRGRRSIEVNKYRRSRLRLRRAAADPHPELRAHRHAGRAADRQRQPPVQCRYPESISLEDLLVDIQVGLEEFSPSLIVMDSISSIEHASSEKGFRQFIIGMASLLREHGRSALMTQTVMAGETAGHTSPYL